VTEPRVLVLDLALDRTLYRPTDHWRALLGPVELQSVHLPDGEPVPDPEAYSHVIITGSEASIVEPLPWFPAAEALVRRAVSLGRPLLGSCFGHQLVARALLGPWHVRRAARPEFGWFPVVAALGDHVLQRPGEPVWMFTCHFDEVCDLPSPWRVLGTTERCAVGMMQLGERPVWGVQAHPEIGPAAGQALLQGLAERRPEIRPAVAAALAAGPRDDGFGARLVAELLRH
jgi:GMP synthase-like glutamine amidotransferase